MVYQTHLLLGQLAGNRGDRVAAYAAYQEARKALEALRTRLQSEELKIAFVKNRMQVYEAMVELYLDPANEEISADEVFSCIEAAKSRSMIEMIFQSGQSLPMGEAGQSEFVRKIRDLREELNWYYHRIELEQLRPEEKSRERIERLQQEAQSHEKELLRALRELPAHERENATLEAPADFSVTKLQASLPAGAALVEYYSAGDRGIHGAICAAVAARDTGTPRRLIPGADRADSRTASRQACRLCAAWAAPFFAVSRLAQWRGVSVRRIYGLICAERDRLRLVPAKEAHREAQLIGSRNS